MPAHKHVVIAALAILLLAMSPARSTVAQRTSSSESNQKNQAATESDAKSNEHSNAQPEAAVQSTPVPVPENKDSNDRLPFMAQSERESHEQAPSATGLLLRTLGALLLIVGLIVAAAFGMKRFGGARFGAPKEDAPELAVLNSIALGDRRSLAIVRFGERTLLLGSTAQAVTLLAENETPKIAPRVQSVADMLHETASVPFAEELATAADNLQELSWKGDPGVQW